MGANQSARRPGGANNAIPVRPRTPLRFGSVPTALPVNPAKYNTRPFKLPYAESSYSESVTSVLSQESYLNSPTSSVYSNSNYSPQFQSASPPSSHSTMHSGRYICTSFDCPFGILGFSTLEELEAHIASGNHLIPRPGLDFEFESFAPTQEEIHSQHPAVHQRQHILQDQQRQQFQQASQCSCQQCVRQWSDLSFAKSQYALQQPSNTTRDQRPLPPTNAAFYGSGPEYMPWQANEQPPAGFQYQQNNYSPMIESGSYMQNWSVHSAGQSLYM
ncbi:hypothetical protein RUND412_007626 [Rhizina undulata]